MLIKFKFNTTSMHSMLLNNVYLLKALVSLILNNFRCIVQTNLFEFFSNNITKYKDHINGYKWAHQNIYAEKVP